jgi:hypothetical protein
MLNRSFHFMKKDQRARVAVHCRGKRDTLSPSVDRWFEQTMQVNDHVLDRGMVDVPLAGTAPRIQGRLIAGENSDDIERLGINEVDALWVFDLAAKNQMK